MSGQFLIIMMSGFLILDVYIIYILNKVSSSREAEQRISLMQQQEILHLQMYQANRFEKIVVISISEINGISKSSIFNFKSIFSFSHLVRTVLRIIIVKRGRTANQSYAAARNSSSSDVSGITQKI